MTYYIILFPVISGLLAQIIKFFIKSNKKKFHFKSLLDYSGMPSGHSAITISLTTIIALEEGLNSSLFALSAIFALVVIRDALGIRKYLGQHGKVLNILVKDLEEDEMIDETYPNLLENIGHTPSQVLVGSIIGFLVSLIGFSILS